MITLHRQSLYRASSVPAKVYPTRQEYIDKTPVLHPLKCLKMQGISTWGRIHI